MNAKEVLEKLKDTIEGLRDSVDTGKDEYQYGRFMAYDSCVNEIEELLESLLK